MNRPLNILFVLAAVGCNGGAGHANADETGSSTGVAADTSTGSGPVDTSGADTTTGSDTSESPAVVPAPGGLRRLRADQYVATVSVLLGGPAAAVASPPPDQSLLGFDSIGGSNVPLSPAAVEQYERSAIDIAQVVAEEPYTLAAIVPCVVDGPLDESCYVDVAEKFGRAAWRRPITDDENDRLVDIARVARQLNADSFAVGLKYEIAMILEAPAFIYAVELGEEHDDGTRWLTTDEWVTRTALFVLGRAPSAQTFAQVDLGTYDGEDAPRVLAGEWLGQADARAAVGRFFDELLRVREVVNSGKDPELFPLFTPELAASMRTESLLLVEDVVFGEDQMGDARRLFDAEYTFVDPLLAEIYGVSVAGPDFERVELPASQGRLGVLSHPSILAVGSHYDRNSPTRRGLFIQRNLLCNDVPPPPGDVDTNLPEPVEPTTLRARLEGHLAQGGSCVGCHGQTDPPGFAFEHFDASGMWRELDNGFPIDATGTVDGLGSFDGAAELAQLVHDDPRLAACMVRNLYRHAIGHLEDDGTADALEYLADDFAGADFDFQRLVVEMVDNPAFRQVGEPQ